jgi:hypothetical protein
MRFTIDHLVKLDICMILSILFIYLSSSDITYAMSAVDAHQFILGRNVICVNIVFGGALINSILMPALYYFDPRYEEWQQTREKEAKEAKTKEETKEENT